MIGYCYYNTTTKIHHVTSSSTPVSFFHSFIFSFIPNISILGPSGPGPDFGQSNVDRFEIESEIEWDETELECDGHLPQRMDSWENYQCQLVEIDSGCDEMEHLQHGCFHERMDGGEVATMARESIFIVRIWQDVIQLILNNFRTYK